MLEKYRSTMTGDVLRAWAADADAEVAALRKDAERYRWLRDCDKAWLIQPSDSNEIPPDEVRWAPGELDAALDAAMAAAPAVGAA